MTHIYLALVDTPGLFASLIRCFIHQRHIHVVISMDADLEEAYSVGRRNPFIPILAGFEKENKEKIYRAFPTAKYMIFEMECSVEQKRKLQEALHRDYQRRYQFHYTILGLPFIVLGIPFYQKKHYTCSSYIARLMGECGIPISEKHFSLVTPRDFSEYPNKRKIFDGDLSELVQGQNMYRKYRVQSGGGI